MRDIAGKVAFITGGASGIGFAMAKAMLDKDVRVCIADRNPTHMAAAQDQLVDYQHVDFLTLDVTDRSAMRSAAGHVMRREVVPPSYTVWRLI